LLRIHEGFTQDVPRIYQGFAPGSLRIDEEFAQDWIRNDQGFVKGSQRIGYAFVIDRIDFGCPGDPKLAELLISLRWEEDRLCGRYHCN